jgi:hypothetical protein
MAKSLQEEQQSRIAELEAALVTARNDALTEAIDVCTVIIKNYDVMKTNGSGLPEPFWVQKAAKGMVSLAREDIRNLKV